jgi:hypothetical protein
MEGLNTNSSSVLAVSRAAERGWQRRRNHAADHQLHREHDGCNEPQVLDGTVNGAWSVPIVVPTATTIAQDGS